MNIMNGRGPNVFNHWTKSWDDPTSSMELKKIGALFSPFPTGYFQNPAVRFWGCKPPTESSGAAVFDGERILGESIPNLILYTVGVRLDV